ncbi:hypothetical protein [Solirubrum puertoriconensis]|uniref:Uncharacterized protein n=1 Tax=Solirubrum puertoriconensis TaxID=1751427 RepID=A0A9X0L6H1_SOLP1|nr:hypothetical protein [Solirubrum puertoriconensis]KUG09834.1 hypothetical protein ASU33_19385 [Solirubrum puertoriconensis]
MNQFTTTAHNETPQPNSSRIAPTAPSKPAVAQATAPATAPAPRMRYWEQMDPASRSLYPVD